MNSRGGRLWLKRSEVRSRLLKIETAGVEVGKTMKKCRKKRRVELDDEEDEITHSYTHQTFWQSW